MRILNYTLIWVPLHLNVEYKYYNLLGVGKMLIKTLCIANLYSLYNYLEVISTEKLRNPSICSLVFPSINSITEMLSNI